MLDKSDIPGRHADRRDAAGGAAAQGVTARRALEDLAPVNPLARENQGLGHVIGAQPALRLAGVPVRVAVAHILRRAAGVRINPHVHPWLELTCVVEGTIDAAVGTGKRDITGFLIPSATERVRVRWVSNQ